MYRQWLTMVVSLFLCAASLTGCGSDVGGGAALLATSYITATPSSGIINSDVATWINYSSGAKSTQWTGWTTTPAADVVNLTVQSSAYTASSGSNSTAPLPVRIASATVTFSTADSASRAIPTQYQSIGTNIPSAGSVVVPIEMVSQNLKQWLGTYLDNTSTYYRYNATITLNLIEIGTGKTGAVSTALRVNIADYIDK